MLTKATSWMKILIASPTPRGVPVSLVRPWIWSLYYIRFRYQINSSSLTSMLDETTDVESCISLPAVFFHHRPILESVVCLHTTVSCPPICIFIGVLVIIWLSNRSSTLSYILCYWLIVSRICLPVRRISLILDSKDWFLNKYFYWKTGRDKLGTRARLTVGSH